jgi:hypothetical protein
MGRSFGIGSRLKKTGVFFTGYKLLWLYFFFYTALASVFIQFILLPYVFPKWHAGDGLLITSFDAVGFHNIAVNLAGKIHTIGWSAWKLRPEGHAPAGIAAIIYALIVPKPWALIPLNAALHATAAIIIFKLILFLLSDFKKALFCVLPFMFYPSAAIWYSQIHKDGYSIFGIVLIIYGWVLFFKEAIKSDNIRKMLLSAFYIIFGAFMVWIVRPYIEEITAYLGIFISLILFFNLLFISKRLAFKKLLRAAILNLLVISVILPGNVFKSPHKDVFLDGRAQHFDTSSVNIFEQKYKSFLMTRDGSIASSTLGKSDIDADVYFHSFTDSFLYLPRAIQIAFLVPFPYQWFAKGTSEATTFQRRIIAVEMIGIYFTLLFLPFTIWYWRKRIELWIILFFCVSLLILHSLVITNMGTFYRVRYGPLMVIVGLGMAGFIKILELRVKKCAE